MISVYYSKHEHLCDTPVFIVFINALFLAVGTVLGYYLTQQYECFFEDESRTPILRYPVDPLSFVTRRTPKLFLRMKVEPLSSVTVC